jgi:hypothetical protein
MKPMHDSPTTPGTHTNIRKTITGKVRFSTRRNNPSAIIRPKSAVTTAKTTPRAEPLPPTPKKTEKNAIAHCGRIQNPRENAVHAGTRPPTIGENKSADRRDAEGQNVEKSKSVDQLDARTSVQEPIFGAVNTSCRRAFSCRPTRVSTSRRARFPGRTWSPYCIERGCFHRIS